MLWFISLTQRCNKNCRYCGGGDIEALLEGPHPLDIDYDFSFIKHLGRDPDPIICFYGGEPLLKLPLLEKTMKMLPERTKYCLQTNGTLLDLMKDSVLENLDTIMISIDGTRSHTDVNRGDGTYDLVMSRLSELRKRGFHGDLVARMTVTTESDIYRDVSHLLSLNLFDHVHWQLDCLWDSASGERIKAWCEWRDTSYNPGVSRLFVDFMNELENGHILPIVPFLGLMESYLDAKPVLLRCDAGRGSFNITTGGLVTACPIAPDFDGGIVGKLSNEFDPESVRDSCLISGWCADCDVLSECGGRCLYANKTGWWGEDGFREVCGSVRHLLTIVRSSVPAIRSLLEEGRVDRERLVYPKFNNSLEIIP